MSVGCSICDQHDGLITLATLARLIILHWRHQNGNKLGDIRYFLLFIKVTVGGDMYPMQNLESILEAGREIRHILAFDGLDRVFHLFNIVRICSYLFRMKLRYFFLCSIAIIGGD